MKKERLCDMYICIRKRKRAKQRSLCPRRWKWIEETADYFYLLIYVHSAGGFVCHSFHRSYSSPLHQSSPQNADEIEFNSSKKYVEKRHFQTMNEWFESDLKNNECKKAIRMQCGATVMSDESVIVWTEQTYNWGLWLCLWIVCIRIYWG